MRQRAYRQQKDAPKTSSEYQGARRWAPWAWIQHCKDRKNDPISINRPVQKGAAQNRKKADTVILHQDYKWMIKWRYKQIYKVVSSGSAQILIVYVNGENDARLRPTRPTRANLRMEWDAPRRRVQRRLNDIRIAESRPFRTHWIRGSHGEVPQGEWSACRRQHRISPHFGITLFIFIKFLSNRVYGFAIQLSCLIVHRSILLNAEMSPIFAISVFSSVTNISFICDCITWDEEDLSCACLCSLGRSASARPASTPVPRPSSLRTSTMERARAATATLLLWVSPNAPAR